MPQIRVLGRQEWDWQKEALCSEAVRKALKQVPELQKREWKVVTREISLCSYDSVFIAQLMWKRFQMALGRALVTPEFQADWNALWEWKRVEVLVRKEDALVCQEEMKALVSSSADMQKLQRALSIRVPSTVRDRGNWQVEKAEKVLQEFAHLIRYPSLDSEVRKACRLEIYNKLQSLTEEPLELTYWTSYRGEEISCYRKDDQVVFTGRRAVGSAYYDKGTEVEIKTKEEQRQVPPLWTLNFGADGSSTFMETVIAPGVLKDPMKIICRNDEEVSIKAAADASEDLLGKHGFKARHKAASLTEFILFKLDSVLEKQEELAQRLVKEWCQFLQKSEMFSVVGGKAIIPAGQGYTEVRFENMWSPVAASEDCTFTWTFRRYANGDVAVVLEKSTNGRSTSRGASERCLEISLQHDAPNQIHLRQISVNGNEWVCLGVEWKYTLSIEEGKLRFVGTGKEAFSLGIHGVEGSSGQQTPADVQKDLTYILRTLTTIDDIKKSAHTVLVREQQNQETEYYDLAGRKVPREFVLGQLRFQQGVDGSARPYGMSETYLALHLREEQNRAMPLMTHNGEAMAIARCDQGIGNTRYQKVPWKGMDMTGLTAEQAGLLSEMAAKYALLDPKKSYFWVSTLQEVTNSKGEKRIFNPGFHLQEEISLWLLGTIDLVQATEREKGSFIFADFLANVHASFKYTEVPIPETKVMGGRVIKDGNVETLFQSGKIFTMLGELYVLKKWAENKYSDECSLFENKVNDPNGAWHNNPAEAYVGIGRYVNLNTEIPLDRINQYVINNFLRTGHAFPEWCTEAKLFFDEDHGIWYTPRKGCDCPLAMEFMAFCLYEKAKVDPFFREGLKIFYSASTHTVIQLKPGCLLWGSDSDGQGRNYLGRSLKIVYNALLDGSVLVSPTEEEIQAPRHQHHAEDC